MSDVRTVVTRVAALLDDPQQSWATNDYILPHMQQAYDDIYYRLADYDLGFDEQVIVLPGITAGTSDFTQYMQPGKPLEFLFNPLYLEYKNSGDPDINYTEVRRVDRIPDVQNSAPVQYWEFRGGTLYFTPSINNVDLRLRAEMLFSAIRTSDDQIMNQFVLSLAFKTAELVGVVRGNPGWITSYKMMGDNALDGLETKLVKQDQGLTRRVGRVNRRRTSPRQLNKGN